MGIGQLVKKVATRFNKAKTVAGDVLKKFGSLAKIGYKGFKKGLKLYKANQPAIRNGINTWKNVTTNIANATDNQKVKDFVNRSNQTTDKLYSKVDQAVNRTSKVTDAVDGGRKTFKRMIKGG